MLYDTHYKEGKKFTFKKFDLNIAGLLFLPKDFDENKKYPAAKRNFHNTRCNSC